MRKSISMWLGIVTLVVVACSDESSVSPPSTTSDCSALDSGAGTVADGCASTADSGSDASNIVVIPGGPRFLGRVDTTDAAGPRFSWTGSGLVAVVSGTKISVTLRTEDNVSFYQPVVDGVPGQRFSVAPGEPATTVLGTELPEGDHVVELYRDTEAMFGDTVFLGFADGAVKGAPAGRERLIEVIGDSISAGAGNLGEEEHTPSSTTSCFPSPDTQSAYYSYGLHLGRLLDAEVSVLAQSGWGLFRGAGGNTTTTLPSVYANTLGTKPAPAWSFTRQADAVVINLGTNDASVGDPGTAYETAYVAFLETVRSRYPNAWIFLTIGPMYEAPAMRQHIANVVAASGDPKVVKLDIPVRDKSHTGCGGHPNVAQHESMATTLAPMMKEKLGW